VVTISNCHLPRHMLHLQCQRPPRPMSRFQALGVSCVLIRSGPSRTSTFGLKLGSEFQRRFTSFHKQHSPLYDSFSGLDPRLSRLSNNTTTHLLASRPLNQRYFATMDTQELKHYLADAPPSVVRLEIEKHFEALSDKQKRYAHFISK